MVGSTIDDSRIPTVNQVSQMQAYADSLGAFSYSGADIKAVVFLPLDRNGLRDQIKSLLEEQTVLRRELGELESKVAQVENDPTWQFRLMEKERHVAAEIFAGRERIKQLEQNYAQENAVGTNAVVLGDLQTISYQVHRETFPVRTLGRVYPKSYTRGPRTIAGSMIFTVLNKQVLWDLVNSTLAHYSTGVYGSDGSFPEFTTALADQLPPFDINLLFANEVGDISYMVLYGVQIVNEGQTMSIQDLLTENVIQYTARDIDPLRPMLDKRRIIESGHAPPPTSTDVVKKNKARRDQRLNPFL
jgi:hypothetical protein